MKTLTQMFEFGGRRSRAKNRFLAKAIELEETPPPYAARLTIWIVVAFLVTLLFSTAIIEVDEVAIAEGTVVPAGNIIAIQHYDGGIAEEILVREGQLVRKGDPLIKLMPLDAEADLSRTLSQHASLSLQTERLLAVAQNRPPDFSGVDAQFAGLIAAEQAAYDAELASHKSLQSILENQLLRQESEEKRLTNEVAKLKRDEKLLKDEIKTREDLYAKGLSTRQDLFGIRRDYESLTLSLGRTQDELQSVAAAIAEAKARLNEHRTTRISEALRQVGENQLQIAELDQIIKRLTGRAERTTITAPRDGVIEALSLHSSMAVIQPGQTIMTLVPTGEELVVEANVRPDDIGRLAVGQTVDIRLSSYDFTTYGSIAGNLINISATSFPGDDGRVFYRARVRLEHPYLGADPSANPVLPGMQAVANIKTGQKTILTYLAKPISRGFRQAFSEP